MSWIIKKTRKFLQCLSSTSFLIHYLIILVISISDKSLIFFVYNWVFFCALIVGLYVYVSQKVFRRLYVYAWYCTCYWMSAFLRLWVCVFVCVWFYRLFILSAYCIFVFNFTCTFNWIKVRKEEKIKNQYDMNDWIVWPCFVIALYLSNLRCLRHIFFV